jgi:hypothetical protein
MSSFIKKTKLGNSGLYAEQKGFRAYSNHQFCMSTGIDSLDEVMNGYLIGGLTLIIEDSHSQFYLNLIRCSMAEGIASSHDCIVLG